MPKRFFQRPFGRSNFLRWLAARALRISGVMVQAMALGLVMPLAQAQSVTIGVFGSFKTVQVTTPPLVFHGTGSLGLPDSEKNFKTMQVVTPPLVFHGTGSLGLPASEQNFKTVQVVTPPLIFHGTGKLIP